MIMDPNTKVYIAIGAVDMRKAINGLSTLVAGTLRLDVFSGCFFAFSNKRRSMVKILYWDSNGFCLWQKRLEKSRFRWPNSSKEVLEITHRELQWLLSGLDIKQSKAHKTLVYSKAY